MSLVRHPESKQQSVDESKVIEAFNHFWKRPLNDFFKMYRDEEKAAGALLSLRLRYLKDEADKAIATDYLRHLIAERDAAKTKNKKLSPLQIKLLAILYTWNQQRHEAVQCLSELDKKPYNGVFDFISDPIGFENDHVFFWDTRSKMLVNVVEFSIPLEKLMQVSGSSGNPYIQFFVGLQCLDRSLYSIAIENFRLSAAQGCWGSLQYLAFMYEEGLGVTANAEMANTLCTFAAEINPEAALLASTNDFNKLLTLGGEKAKVAAGNRYSDAYLAAILFCRKALKLNQKASVGQSKLQQAHQRQQVQLEMGCLFTTGYMLKDEQLPWLSVSSILSGRVTSPCHHSEGLRLLHQAAEGRDNKIVRQALHLLAIESIAAGFNVGKAVFYLFQASHTDKPEAEENKEVGQRIEALSQLQVQGRGLQHKDFVPHGPEFIYYSMLIYTTRMRWDAANGIMLKVYDQMVSYLATALKDEAFSQEFRRLLEFGHWGYIAPCIFPHNNPVTILKDVIYERTMTLYLLRKRGLSVQHAQEVVELTRPRVNVKLAEEVKEGGRRTIEEKIDTMVEAMILKKELERLYQQVKNNETNAIVSIQRLLLERLPIRARIFQPGTLIRTMVDNWIIELEKIKNPSANHFYLLGVLYFAQYLADETGASYKNAVKYLRLVRQQNAHEATVTYLQTDEHNAREFTVKYLGQIHKQDAEADKLLRKLRENPPTPLLTQLWSALFDQGDAKEEKGNKAVTRVFSMKPGT